MSRPLAPALNSLQRQSGIALICYVISAALIVSGIFHLGVALVSDRPWAGPLSWRKPTTFGLVVRYHVGIGHLGCFAAAYTHTLPHGPPGCLGGGLRA
ncbi:MAG: hypothetical protein ACRCYU_21755 [Nocardioides sp.]